MELGYSAVFSNLAKASEKQWRLSEAELFWRLSGYFDDAQLDQPLEGEPNTPNTLNAEGANEPVFKGLARRIAEDDSTYFPAVKSAAEAAEDRGALRMAVWGSKVNAIQKSVIERAEKLGDALLQDKSIFVCEACGFIFIGREAPEICPVCKAPRSRFSQIS